jgi:hypothetical protein
MPMDSISLCSNTLYLYYVDAVSSLSWLSASTMTLGMVHAHVGQKVLKSNILRLSLLSD